MLKEMGSFRAVGHDGGRYTVYIYAPSGAGPDQPVGQQDLRTSAGQRVNRIDKGKYQVVETNVTLTSTDPNAP